MIMSSDDVRIGMTNAVFNEEGADLLFYQIFILAIVAGVATGSWWTFGKVLLICFCLLFGEISRYFLVVFLALLCGYVGYLIGELVFEDSGAMIILAILGFLSSLGWNLAGLQWMEDIGK